MMGSARRSSELKWSIRQLGLTKIVVAGMNKGWSRISLRQQRPIPFTWIDETRMSSMRRDREECIACCVCHPIIALTTRGLRLLEAHPLFLSSGLFPLYSSGVVYILYIHIMRDSCIFQHLLAPALRFVAFSATLNPESALYPDGAPPSSSVVYETWFILAKKKYKKS